MTITEIKTLMTQDGTPAAYLFWPEKQVPNLPYKVWYFPNTNNFAADDKVYQQIAALNIELYTATKDFEKEQALEAVLDGAGLVWDKTETYLNTEHMFQVLYTTEVLINYA